MTIGLVHREKFTGPPPGRRPDGSSSRYDSPSKRSNHVVEPTTRGKEPSMGDSMMDKAKDLLAGNKDKVDEGIDKAAEMAKEKTPDQADAAVDAAADKAKDVVEGL
jgi:hypothetical protein